MFKKFILLNKQYANKLESRYPHFFQDADHVGYFTDQLNLLLNGKYQYTILEAGGIDRPLLKKSADYTYVGLDVEEKSNCYEIYDKFYVSSIEQSIGNEKFDYIVSKFLLEHVPDNKASIHVMYNALKNGGEMLHIFPSKNHPRSLLTRMVSHKMQNYLISKIRPWAPEGVTGYKTYFSLCSKKELENYLGRTGYGEVKIKPFWGGSDYFKFFLPAFIFISLFNRACEKLHFTYFASALVLYAKK